MERRYKQLNLEEGDRITELKARGFSLRAIAEALGRSPSTIAREVGRNSSPSYMLYMSHR
ncbi:MAG: helix-turn-helix domain-containing protein, partial [Nitrospirae bacterium]|nr:helix-turn-helix domain-containing protein [Nitrospirota bacterium]